MCDTLQISEIFQSIQGESTHSGLPCTFIRLAGCNLQCHWCDTPQAAGGAGVATGIEGIMQRVRAFGNELVCVTGGEPLLQPRTVDLIQRLLDGGFGVSLETNGSLDISALPPGVCRVVDVKCPSSGQCGSTLESNLACLGPEDNLKFVVADRADFEWALGLVGTYRFTEVCPVLFSPVALPRGHENAYNQTEAFLAGARELAAWIIASGLQVRLQLQLHKILWPESTAGV